MKYAIVLFACLSMPLIFSQTNRPARSTNTPVATNISAIETNYTALIEAARERDSNQVHTLSIKAIELGWLARDKGYSLKEAIQFYNRGLEFNRTNTASK